MDAVRNIEDEVVKGLESADHVVTLLCDLSSVLDCVTLLEKMQNMSIRGVALV